MNKREWNKIKDVFAGILDQPENGRAEYLEHLCGGDEILRREVNSLLRAHEETQHLIDDRHFAAKISLMPIAAITSAGCLGTTRSCEK